MDPRRRAALTAGLALTWSTARAARPAGRRGFALALGSGSMHGLAHVGVLRALERARLQPELVVGSSVGAVVGVLWAAGLDSARIEALAERLDWRSSASWTLPWRGLRRLDGLRALVAEATGGRSLEALPRRFAAVATALSDGMPVVLARGPADLAVAASSAIPVLFEPVRVDGRDLVDGSLSAPVPVDAARALGARRVVAVDVAYRPHEAPATALPDIGFQAMHILVNRLADEQVRRAEHALRLNLHHLMTGPHAEPDALMHAGEKAMRALVPSLRAGG